MSLLYPPVSLSLSFRILSMDAFMLREREGEVKKKRKKKCSKQARDVSVPRKKFQLPCILFLFRQKYATFNFRYHLLPLPLFRDCGCCSPGSLITPKRKKFDMGHEKLGFLCLKRFSEFSLQANLEKSQTWINLPTKFSFQVILVEISFSTFFYYKPN